MCSIVGFAGVWEDQTIRKIMINSRIRGLHSFGYSYANNGQIITKKFLNYNTFIETICEEKPSKFIAHFRYSTSGDWKNQDNNQPVSAGNLSLVFNGVIDMRSKPEMEKHYRVSMNTENDGEIALMKYQKSKEDMLDFIGQAGRTFAGMILSSNGEAYAVRNNLRPLSFAENDNAIYYASTNDILRRSGLKDCQTTKPNKYYEITVGNRK